MRTTTLLATLVLALISADAVEAQRRAAGGRRSRSEWRRPEEISNRVAVYFREVTGPETAGEKAADLNTIDLVRKASAADQVSVLYLHSGELEERPVKTFEALLFRADSAGDQLGIKLRLFHCGQLDISKDPALKKRYGKKAPLFVAFDKSGKELQPVSMSGLKPDRAALEGLLDRASKGAFKPLLPSFAKKYGKLVLDLEKLLRERSAAQDDRAKASDDKAKLKKANRELASIAKAEQKLLEKEQEMLADMRFPERGSKRLGGRRPNRRDNTSGNTGKGNTGRGRVGG